jgi:hypothetical protein
VTLEVTDYLRVSHACSRSRGWPQGVKSGLSLRLRVTDGLVGLQIASTVLGGLKGSQVAKGLVSGHWGSS